MRYLAILSVFLALPLAGCFALNKDYVQADRDLKDRLEPIIDKAIEDGYYRDADGNWQPIVAPTLDDDGNVITSREDRQQTLRDLMEAWEYRTSQGEDYVAD